MPQAHELRFAFTFDDYDQALQLFRDVLGLEVLEIFDEQGGRGVIMSVPHATLELFDREHTDMVDRIEVGRPTGSRHRIAIRVDALADAGDAVAAVGALPEADEVATPWGDLNRRYRLAGGFQLTLFQGS